MWKIVESEVRRALADWRDPAWRSGIKVSSVAYGVAAGLTLRLVLSLLLALVYMVQPELGAAGLN